MLTQGCNSPRSRDTVERSYQCYLSADSRYLPNYYSILCRYESILVNLIISKLKILTEIDYYVLLLCLNNIKLSFTYV